MNKLRVYLDYKCFPVWLYDSNGELISNDLPKELLEDNDIENLMLDIQDIYNSLFIDNPVEFKYIGFENEFSRLDFFMKVDKAMNLIKVKVGDLYIIEKELDF